MKMINDDYERIEIESPEVLPSLREHFGNLFNGTNLAILNGDAKETLKQLPNDSVHCCVTSPPYYKLRDYGAKGQIGQETTLSAYIDSLVSVFHEVKRVLHPSGTLWLNLGDTYSNKSLMMVPARVVMALQDAGWTLRSNIVWHKKAPMPESITDRPTNAWEPIYLLSKNTEYFYDAEAVKEPSVGPKNTRPFGKAKNADRNDQGRTFTYSSKRNLRNVWQLGPEPYRGSHFAPFPTEIPRRAILAGTSERGCCPVCFNPWKRVVEKKHISGVYGDLRKRADAPGAVTSKTSVFRTGDAVETRTAGWKPTCNCGESHTLPCIVLDVFGGSGTSGKVALELGRRGVLVELNPEYCKLAKERCLGEPVVRKLIGQ